MPSERVDHNGLPSSSFFSEEMHFPNEQRQVGFWKTETKPESYGTNPVASPTLESQMMRNFELNDSYLTRNQKVSGSLEKYAVGAERAAGHSLGRSLDHGAGKRSTLDVDPASYSKGADGINVMGAQYENGLFSSSLSELFSRKLRLTSNHALFGHSFGAAASDYNEGESLETLKEIEAKTIGNLLPSDDDLLSGVTDGLDYLAQSYTKEDTDDFDLFSSVGGLDLGEDGFSGQQDSEILFGGSANAFVGKHPHVEHPSRTLFVRNINSNVEDSELRTLFELYGDIRTLYTACKHRGFVMISYYDIRAARDALRALQNKPLRRRKLDIHFSIPKDYPSEQDINQGTLVIFNLDPSVPNEELRQICTAYGEIKDIRDTIQGSHQKIIEFYDVRAAEAALRGLNRTEIAGKQIKIEAACPSDAKWSGIGIFPSEIELDESGLKLQQVRSPSNSTLDFFGSISHGGITPPSMSNGTFTQGSSGPFKENGFQHGISSSVPNNLPSLLRVESRGTPSALPGHSPSQSLGNQLSLGLQTNPSFHPHLLNDCLPNGTNIGGSISGRIDNHKLHRVNSNVHLLELNDTVFGAAGNGSCPTPGHHYMWSTAQRPQPHHGIMWPNSPSFVNGVHAAAHPSSRMHAIPGAPSPMLNTLLPQNDHHVGSAPSMNPSLWDRCHSYMGESPDTSGFHPGSLGSMRVSGNSSHHPPEFLPPNMFPHVGGNFMDMAIASKNMALHQRHMMISGRGQMIPMLSSSFDSPNERARIRRNEGNSNQGDNKKQFELDLDRIMRGDDKRTTLMIKNIPNKYTSKMLLAAIDERHRGTYDFIYLPIDFKNKCNVGYAFINMTEPSMIVPFYQVFNGKKWEKFNSEKVAVLAYARIQGKAALIAHFQNSSLMNEDKRCRPILFNTDGPNAGDQVPFPVGVNVRPRPSKTRASSSDENYQDTITYMSTGEEIAYEDFMSPKDSD